MDGREGRDLARETGLEPATSGVTGRRSNQLSYSRSGRAHDLRRVGGRVKRPGQEPDQEKAWAVTGSNRRPSRCKRDALPLS